MYINVTKEKRNFDSVSEIHYCKNNPYKRAIFLDKGIMYLSKMIPRKKNKAGANPKKPESSYYY